MKIQCDLTGSQVLNRRRVFQFFLAFKNYFNLFATNAKSQKRGSTRSLNVEENGTKIF